MQKEKNLTCPNEGLDRNDPLTSSVVHIITNESLDRNDPLTSPVVHIITLKYQIMSVSMYTKIFNV